VKWLCIGLAVFIVLFNLVGLPYPALFDNLPIGFSFLFNAFIVWQARIWS
jgi:hypothetical protein